MRPFGEMAVSKYGEWTWTRHGDPTAEGCSSGPMIVSVTLPEKFDTLASWGLQTLLSAEASFVADC